MPLHTTEDWAGRAALPQSDDVAHRVGESPASLAWGAPLFVWGVWAFLFISAYLYVKQFSIPIPDNEAWFYFVPAMTGHEPSILGWIWEQVSEHRLVMWKTVNFTLLKLSGGDFRSIQFLDVFIPAGLSAALILAARRQRGWTSYADAFLPLALLCWELSGFIPFWAGGNTYFFPLLLTGTLLAVIVRQGMHLTPAGGILAGVCVMLLPMCGGHGMPFFPVFWLWLVACGIVAWRSGEPHARGRAVLLFSLAASAVAVLGLYFTNYNRAETYARKIENLREAVVVALNFASLNFQRAPNEDHPVRNAAVLGTVLLIVLSVAAVAWTAWHARGATRSRAVGLLFFLAALGTLVAGFGYGRGGQGLGILINCHILALPIICGLYFAWGLYRPRTVGLFVQTCLFTVMCFNTALIRESGPPVAKKRQEEYEAFLADLEAGMPPYILMARHRSICSGYDDELGVKFWRMLHDAGFRPFRDMRDDPPFEEVPVSSLEPVGAYEAEVRDGKAFGKGASAYVTFRLPEPRYVGGIRIVGAYGPDPETPFSNLQVSWGMADGSSFSAPASVDFYTPDSPTTVYVAAKIDTICIFPDVKPFAFQASEITLLIPPEGARGQPAMP